MNLVLICFQKHGVRIIVGNFYENKARVIFCEAYKQKMYGAKYAWIITGMQQASELTTSSSAYYSASDITSTTLCKRR